jgi:hypothetical protein
MNQSKVCSAYEETGAPGIKKLMKLIVLYLTAMNINSKFFPSIYITTNT